MKEFFGKILDYFANTAKPELIASLICMFIIAIIAIILGQAIKKADPTKPTKGLAFAAETLVGYCENQIKEILGSAYLKFTPYFLFLVTYIPVAFVIGLFGLPSPMTYFTIPLCLAIVTWFGIQLSAIYFQKIEYLKGFCSPLPTWLPVFVPINILGKLGPLMSLSIRMFGNALAGYILMWLVYWGTGMLSDAIFVPLFNIEGMNIFGAVIASVLHAYFDAFGAFIQMTIFTTLTLLLIASEIPAPVEIDMEKYNKKMEKKALKAKMKAKKA